jgi:adenylate cyclase
VNSHSIKRKLSAILSTDVKEYSRLMGQDEIGTIRTLTAFKEAISTIIQQYKGRVVDSPGDNLLAEFDSVVNAVNAAVEIQRELAERNAELPYGRRMEFRIGINLGDVILEEERIYGDGVNIAARMESLAEGGGICISGTVYDQVKNKLGLEYEYQGEQSVKNISQPVRVYRVLTFPVASTLSGAKAKSALRKKWYHTALTIVAALIIMTAATVIWQKYLRTGLPPEKPIPEKKMSIPLPAQPSIAVLPFLNMSDDPKQDYFSDGLTEDIITGLSKIPRLFVIARNSVFTYKGKTVKIRQVGLELGVHYVLEGSVRKSENRVRITAQLVNATTGGHMWAESYDRELEDIFALQDEITEMILISLEVKLTEGEQARIWRRGTANRKAYEITLKALESYRLMTKDGNEHARQLYQQAASLDPNYALPVVQMSYTHWTDVIYGWSKSPSKSIAQAVELAQTALALDESLADTHVLLGNIYLMKKQYGPAMQALEKAVTLNPNGADVNALLGLMLRYLGRPDEAVERLEKAIRLNPIPPAWYLYNLGDAYRLAGRYEEAMESFKKAINHNPDHFLAWIYLSATYAQMGRGQEARAAADKVLRMKHKFLVEPYAKRLPYKNQEDINSLIAALHKAGLK